MTRAVVFSAIKGLREGRGFASMEVAQVDDLLDRLGIPRDGAAGIGHNGGPQIGLTDQDFRDVAVRLDCEPAQIRAVWEVESGGGWFRDVRADILALDGPGGFIDGPNLPKILFEAHKFDAFTAGRFRQSHPNLSSARWNRALYVGGVGEWERLYRAMALDRTAALKSASVGGAQIMGFNFKLAGFDTVDAFWQAMKTTERAHLDAFAAFIIGGGLGDELRQVSADPVRCRPLAKGYNGEGYRANDYDGKIARAYAKWKGAA